MQLIRAACLLHVVLASALPQQHSQQTRISAPRLSTDVLNDVIQESLGSLESLVSEQVRCQALVPRARASAPLAPPQSEREAHGRTCA